LGRLSDLFIDPRWRRHTLIGTSLAIIGLATFWGVHIRGKDLFRSYAVGFLLVSWRSFYSD
jgi:hypothetical protein